MAMVKIAQIMDELVVELPVEEPREEVLLVLSPDDIMTDEELELEFVEPEVKEETLSFKLPFLPGAPDIEVSDEVEVEEKKDKEKDEDKSKAADQAKDLNWVKEYLNKIPSHKGETLGLERAKSYLGRGANILSKMIQDDHDGKIDISKAEDARIEIENGIARLEKELNKRKKAALSKDDMVKEGQKVGGIQGGGVMVTVPLKISRIARVCINAAVSGGRDIEDIMCRQAEKWKLDDNEKADLVQLIQDMGYYIRRDRGFLIDDAEDFNPRQSYYDHSAIYQA